MKRITRHVRVGFVTMLSALLVAFPVYAAATTPPVLTVMSSPDVFITEFQTNGGSASQEFIELYNSTDHDVIFGDNTGADQWKIQFFSSTAVKQGLPTWASTSSTSNSIALRGTISAHDYFLVSSTGYAPGGVAVDQAYDAANSHLMTDTGGGLQLLSTSTSQATSSVVHDRVMWLDPSANPMLPGGVLVRPGPGKSQQRMPNVDNEYADIDGGISTFELKNDISPLAAWQPPAPVVIVPADPTPIVPPAIITPETPDPPTDIPESNPTDGTTTIPGGQDASNPAGSVTGTSSTGDSNHGNSESTNINTDQVKPLITELLPNPASPLTDADDEYIELYNPGTTDFDLNGYSIEVGTTTLHTFTFGAPTILAAGAYKAFHSIDTHLSLSNSGGQARLRDGANMIVSETAVYGTAVDGTSWTLVNGVWQWSTTPTPNASNLLTTSPVKTTSSSTTIAPTLAVPKKTITARPVTKTAVRTASAVKGATTTKKVKTAPATKSKKTKPAKVAATTAASFTKPKPPIHTGILVAVAVLAVLYGMYEYRHDIANKFAQLRGHRKSSRNDRQQIAWQ